MQSMERAEWTAGIFSKSPVTGNSPAAGGFMELRKHCAYNQTRECFLGLEVAPADLSYANLRDLISTLVLKSGEGLWINPFRGIPTGGVNVPMDLIYLDESYRVIEVVESFPTFRASPSIPPSASVLALPAHSIYSSQTQAGDQLVLCVAEEMEHQLERLSGPISDLGSVQSAALLREKPLWSGGPGVIELEERSPGKLRKNGHGELHEMTLIQPGVKDPRPRKSWLERWWSPDPRKAPREPSPGLAAYYWNGSTPQAHSVRDISSSGLYIVTEERWYPGTLVLMTLHKTDAGEASSERSIFVQSRAVRWGSDGVGLQFVLTGAQNPHKGRDPLVDGAGKKELERFLRQLRKSNGNGA